MQDVLKLVANLFVGTDLDEDSVPPVVEEILLPDLVGLGPRLEADEDKAD